MSDEDRAVRFIEDYRPDLPGVPSQYTEGARFMTGDEVPEGWEARHYLRDDFCSSITWIATVLVEARPIPVPDVAVTLPRDVAERFKDGLDREADDRVLVLACCRALDGDQ